MSYSIRATMNGLLAHLQSNGYFDIAQIGEPKGPPLAQSQRYFGSIIPLDWMIAKIPLSGCPIEVHTFIVRVYQNMFDEPQEQIEIDLADVVTQVTDDLMAGFTINGTVRAVDFAGIYGKHMTAKWGFVDLSGKLYRVVDIVVPCIIDHEEDAVP